jgi:GNAT superfamily N-acetyltransferase
LGSGGRILPDYPALRPNSPLLGPLIFDVTRYGINGVAVIRYVVNEKITVDQFIQVLKSSGLGERRPIDDRECLQSMLDHGNLTVTAWDEDRIVGISRSVTDFSYCCYISDLAVDREYQKMGIGVEMQRITQSKTGKRCKIILRAAPDAMAYYPHIGYEHIDNAFLVRYGTELRG